VQDTRLLDRLIERWHSGRVHYNEGLSAEVIGEFEAANGTELPDQFKSYLSRVNGMIHRSESDADLFCFWPLHLMEWADSYLDRSYADGAPGIPMRRLLVFADQSLCCPAFALDVKCESHIHIVYSLYGYGDESKLFRIADDFAEFLSSYLSGELF
jgi:hypothetical protein